MTDPPDCDVLVVGAGPTGVTLALLLAAEGVRVIAADKAADIHPLPRAAHVDQEIMRVFQALGVADEVMATSRAAARYDFLTAAGEVLMRFDTGAARTPSGWPAANMIHQPSVEAALRRRLGDFANAELWTDRELVSLSWDAEGAVTGWSTPDGTRRVRSRFVVGCDGARSLVRDLCDAGLEDLGFDEPWLVIDTLVHDASRLPQVNLQVCDPRRPTTCVLMGAGRHRWEFMLKPGETPEAVAEDAFIADLLAPWNVEGAVTLERKAVYRFHALVARRWRRGPVLLAGDAAHQMPPFAGQGLCSGVRDAANLAWKLAAVLRGEASEALLDTYQREREPHVRAIIDLAMTMGRTVCITDPDAAAARDRAMLDARAAGAVAGGAMAFPPIEAGAILAGSPAAGTLFPQPWAGSGGSAARLDDVLGPGPWLIRRDAGDALAPVPTFTLADPRLPPFAGDLSAWLARHDAPAVLVRPDRVVFGTGAAQVLVEAYQAAIGHPGDQHPPALPGQRRSCTAVK